MRSLFLVLGLASCAQVTDVPPGELQGVPTDPEDYNDEIAELDRIENPIYAQDHEPDPNEAPAACEGFPDDGSACSQACNPDALRSFIPEGTCATFECPYSDGTTVRVGGCVLPDE